MSATPIDYRSDTVTRPTAAMHEAMFAAPVGDDVFGEDPSINQLEEKCAALFGMEAAVFCPSGTMTNQIAIKCHTQPGDEVICEENSHIYQYEGGGIAFNAGASVKLLHGDRGRISASQVADAIQPDDVHRPVSRLVSLENTSNRGGGCCYDFEEIVKIKSICTERGLALHLDGARVWNAIVAKNEDFLRYGKTFDSISVISRLEQDHRHAKLLAECIEKKSFVKMLLPVETNIIIFELQDGQSAPALVATLKEKGILGYAISPVRVRLVTHLDINESAIQKTIDLFNAL
ncbi:MAG: aminotransferase class V-fold PLP-dependent enzyme [Chitinophagales bacterium]|nr:aminotransferase class V-fold PLP-dependent enzyme [Chitinophagales bacterium]